MNSRFYILLIYSTERIPFPILSSILSLFINQSIESPPVFILFVSYKSNVQRAIYIHTCFFFRTCRRIIPHNWIKPVTRFLALFSTNETKNTSLEEKEVSPTLCTRVERDVGRFWMEEDDLGDRVGERSVNLRLRRVPAFVCLQLVTFAILAATEIALVRFFPDVAVNVLGKLRFHAESWLAQVTLESFHTCVTISVHLQAPRPPVTFTAVLAFVRPHPCKKRNVALLIFPISSNFDY